MIIFIIIVVVVDYFSLQMNAIIRGIKTVPQVNYLEVSIFWKWQAVKERFLSSPPTQLQVWCSQCIHCASIVELYVFLFLSFQVVLTYFLMLGFN
jgi:hypothetical protein